MTSPHHAASHTDSIVCSDALLHRHGDRLTIHWNAGAVLEFPVSWCRAVQADRTGDAEGTQLVLRFTPPQQEDGATFVAVRLHTDQNNSFQVQEFAEILRRELGLSREQAEPRRAFDEQGSEEAAAPPPRLRLVPRSDADWLVTHPGEATQALYDSVLRQHADSDRA